MAIEPSVEGATADGDKVMIRIEAFPPVHVVQVWYQCSKYFLTFDLITFWSVLDTEIWLH